MCMYACMCACMYVCMHACVCICVYMCVCVCVCAFVILVGSVCVRVWLDFCQWCGFASLVWNECRTGESSQHVTELELVESRRDVDSRCVSSIHWSEDGLFFVVAYHSPDWQAVDSGMSPGLVLVWSFLDLKSPCHALSHHVCFFSSSSSPTIPCGDVHAKIFTTLFPFSLLLRRSPSPAPASSPARIRSLFWVVLLRDNLWCGSLASLARLWRFLPAPSMVCGLQ